MGERLEAGLQERFGNHRHVGDIRGRGLFRAIELVADRATKEAFDPTLKLLRAGAARRRWTRGLSVYPMGGTIDGKRGDHVVIAPPYIATAARHRRRSSSGWATRWTRRWPRWRADRPPPYPVGAGEER